MADENLSGPSTSPAPAANTTVTQGSQITAAKFRSLIDTLDAYLQHSHTFSDEYRSNCQCQCGRGSI
jgi:hypothetical protein